MENLISVLIITRLFVGYKIYKAHYRNVDIKIIKNNIEIFLAELTKDIILTLLLADIKIIFFFIFGFGYILAGTFSTLSCFLEMALDKTIEKTVENTTFERKVECFFIRNLTIFYKRISGKKE